MDVTTGKGSKGANSKNEIMTTESAQAQQNIVFSIDDNCEDLPIDEYLKVLESLKIVIENRIRNIKPLVDKKMEDFK